jgi:GDPmannose 4,6-dehydratase
MWLMVQAPAADDYVLATGESHSVRQFIDVAARQFGFAIEWRGNGEAETGIDRDSGRTLVRIDRQNFRPAEVSMLIGRPDKARQQLGWQCRVGFDELVALMAEADDRRVRDGGILL